MSTTAITAPAGLPYIEITRAFGASRDLLFRAHTEPELMVQWLGPRRLAMTVEHMEIRDGGTWHYTHRDAGGGAYGFHGVFHGTPSPDGIVQTFEYEGAPGHVSLDSLTFEESDGRTILHAKSVFQSVEDRDAMVASGMEGGLTEGYERLDELIAGLIRVP
jgi:uncharacterized protein YndB with AHSA1/START domain